MGGTLTLPPSGLALLAGASSAVALPVAPAARAALGRLSSSVSAVALPAPAGLETGMGSPTLERTLRVGGCRKRRGALSAAEAAAGAASGASGCGVSF